MREEIKKRLIERMKKLEQKPVLAIVQVGDRPDSNLYIKNKIKFADEIGAGAVHKRFEEGVEEEILIKEIENLNEDRGVHGIIIQLPLPQHLNAQKILSYIKKGKDADGLTELEEEGRVLVTPATARAVLAILDFYKIEIEGKKVAVLGQSLLAGKPIADELERIKAQVERCDINTKNVPEISKNSDILISAVGKVGLVTKDFTNKNQVIIDVGINRVSPPNPPLTLRGGQESKSFFVGDVDFAEVEPLVRAITPVPGGVGPVTVACLFKNLLELSVSNI